MSVKDRVEVPEAALFSPSDVASSVFLPLFIVELARTANTPRRHTTRTRSRTDAAGRGERGWDQADLEKEKTVFNFII